MILKTLLFIGLKIAEIGVIIFIPYWVGIPATKLLDKFLGDEEKLPKGIIWLTGLGTIGVLILLGMFFEWLYKTNWNIIEEIIWRLK